ICRQGGAGGGGDLPADGGCCRRAVLDEHVQHDPGVVAVIAPVEKPLGGAGGEGGAQLIGRRVSAVFLHGVQVGDRRVGDGLFRAWGREVGQAAAGACFVFVGRGPGADGRPSPCLPHRRPEGCQPCLVVAGQGGEQVGPLPVLVSLFDGDGAAAG